MKKTLAALILVLSILLALLPAASAAGDGFSYVALGDSVAAGTALPSYSGYGSTPREGYVALTAAALDAELTDWTRDGMTTQELIDLLEQNPVLESVKDADLITISIGSNDVHRNALKMFVAALDGQYPYDPYELELFLRQNLGSGSLKDALKTINTINEYVNREENLRVLREGVNVYRENWNTIMSILLAANPDAVILVTDFFNSYSVFNFSLLGYSCNIGALADELLGDMSKFLHASPYAEFYTIIDMTDLDTNLKIDFANLKDSYLDPHPSVAGHAEIARRIGVELKKLHYLPYEASFTDVKDSGAWYYDAVCACAEAGLISGKDDGSFALAEELTWAQAAAFAVRAHQSMNGRDILTAADQTGESWYEVYFDYALGYKLIEAVPEEPDAVITRGEAALLFAAAMGETEPDYSYYGYFADVPENDRLADAVYILYGAGIVNGRSAEKRLFEPEAPFLRQEVAVILYRMLNEDARLVPTPAERYDEQPPEQQEPSKATLSWQGYELAIADITDDPQKLGAIVQAQPGYKLIRFTFAATDTPIALADIQNAGQLFLLKHENGDFVAQGFFSVNEITLDKNTGELVMADEQTGFSIFFMLPEGSEISGIRALANLSRVTYEAEAEAA